MRKVNKTTKPEWITEIHESLARGKGGWAVGTISGHLALAAAAPSCTKLEGGFLVMLGMSVAEIKRLRDACDATLGAGKCWAIGCREPVAQGDKSCAAHREGEKNPS